MPLEIAQHLFGLGATVGGFLDVSTAPSVASRLASVDLTAYGGSLATLEFVGRLISCLFLFAFGACVGSFLNVVVYRIPAGLSVVTPPSRCPTCGGRLTWRENLPVLGWLLLRGKCRFCRQPISIQYPLIEAAIGIVFALLYLHFYILPGNHSTTGGNGSWLSALVLPWWKAQGFAWSWPLFVAVLLLVAGLVASTIIDARHFIIPGEITWTMSGIGLAAAAVQPFFPVSGRARLLTPPIEQVAPTTCGVALGACFGLLIATILLKTGVLRYSYADYDAYVKPDDPRSSYPFARRETLREIVYLLPTIACGLIGGWVASQWSESQPPVWLGSVASALFGFLIGGATLWMVRILGTLGFGREAMGLGDVHLLASVGMVLGWKAAVWTFALSLPVSLGYAFLAFCVRPFIRLPIRELPLGPHLAFAAILTLLLTPTLRSFDPTLADVFSAAWQGFRIKTGF
ncbi:MAG: prepilin peptidase [Phycisphaerae bacterium]|nr:prepilin peptidase [Phycisphaerae bacterium]